jgi:hypothetical protein
MVTSTLLKKQLTLILKAAGNCVVWKSHPNGKLIFKQN